VKAEFPQHVLVLQWHCRRSAAAGMLNQNKQIIKQPLSTYKAKARVAG